MLGSAPVLIMTNTQSGLTSLKDVAKLASSKGGISFGSGGPGSIGQIVGEMMKVDMKVEMTHVPYRGGAPMSTDLVSGLIPLGIDVITAYVPMMKSGQIKGLAVTSKARSPLAPEVPTVIEAGYPNLIADNYFGVSGPAGMPKDVVDKLSKALVDIVKDPAILKRFEELGVTPMPLGSAEFTHFVDQQIKDWEPGIKAANLKP
jgi:tripartite-type tricarboxylate transporter receptor subunit TctC